MAGGIIGSLMYAVGFKFNSRGLDDADKKVGKLTKGVLGIGSSLGKVALGITGIQALTVTAFAGAGLNAASKFETAMKQVEGATGATAEQMEATRGIAKNLYSNNFGENWDDLGAAIANVQQVTGQTGSELENTTRNAILLRDQFGFDIPESVKSVDTMMKQFGITSEESYNLLAQGAQRGLDKSGELMDSANEYANQFKSLGFTADEMFDVFASGSAEGVFQVDKVGDAVKEFNIRSKDGSKTSSDAFTALGLDAEAMMQVFAKGGPDSKQAFSDIVSMISDIEDPVARNNIGVALMGSQFEDLEINVISAMGAATRSFDKTTKTMDELNKIKFEKPGEALKMFGRQVEVGILIPIGQKLLPYLNAFGQWLSDHKPQIEAVGNAIGDGLGAAINIVSGWIQAAIPYLKQFGAQALQVFGYLIDKGKELWTSIQPVAVMIGETLLNASVQLWPHIQQIGSSIADTAKAFYDWEGFAPVVSGIVAALVTYKAVVGTITVATKIAGAATKAWGAIQKAFNLVMAANPIGIIIAALVGLGIALVVAYKKSDKFRAFIDGMWSGIKTATMATLNFLKTIPNFFMTVFNAVTSFLKTWGVTILVVIGGPIAWIVALVIKHWNEIKAFTFAVFSAIGNWLSTTWDEIKSTVSGAANGIWNAVTNAWNNMTTSIKNAGSNVMTALSEIWDQIKETANGVWSGITDGVMGMWEGIKGGFISGINWVIGKLNDMISKVNNALSVDLPDWMGGGIDVNIPSIPTIDGSHANGLANVPFDGYIGELHKGERVLTAEENKNYSRGYTPESAPARSSRSSNINFTAPSINININGNADEKTIADIRETVRQEMQDIIDAVSRIVGVDIVGAN